MPAAPAAGPRGGEPGETQSRKDEIASDANGAVRQQGGLKTLTLSGSTGQRLEILRVQVAGCPKSSCVVPSAGGEEPFFSVSTFSTKNGARSQGISPEKPSAEKAWTLVQRIQDVAGLLDDYSSELLKSRSGPRHTELMGEEMYAPRLEIIQVAN